LPVRNGNRDGVRRTVARVALGDVGTGLFSGCVLAAVSKPVDLVDDALDVGELELGALANVLAVDGFGSGDIVVHDNKGVVVGGGSRGSALASDDEQDGCHKEGGAEGTQDARDDAEVADGGRGRPGLLDVLRIGRGVALGGGLGLLGSRRHGRAVWILDLSFWRSRRKVSASRL